MLGDTIAAISTPRGKGGVALLRVSGMDAIAITSRVFKPKNGRSLDEVAPRQAIYGAILAPDGTGAWQTVDDGIATVFVAPFSFTGEDTVEITCHGGTLLTETVLTALLTAGARPAEAGEFTRRAFLNGKLGLSAAEALGNALEAQTKEQLTLAHAGMRGKLQQKCESLYGMIRDVLASIYVKIDYPDEDLADLSRDEILSHLNSCAAQLRELSESYRTGHAIAEGIATVICGKPNVGKSSLYNRIVGRDAAIVTDVEGTTRDVLTETASLGRVTLRLFDTAGLRETLDPVEKIGIRRAEDAMRDAELILAVFDGSAAPDAEDLRFIEQLKDASASVIAILNKCDRGANYEDFYRTHFENAVVLSAKSGEGFSELIALTERLFINGALNVREDAVLTNARQYAAILSAKAATERAVHALASGYPIDMCCIDAEDAMSSIAEVDGRAVSEDIVSQIFSHFCVGK